MIIINPLIMTSEVFKIIWYVNAGFTILFILAFSIRLCHLMHFAITERYSKKYPKIRIILALIYIVLSIAFLIYNIVTDEFGNNVFQYLYEGGGGECIDSLILFLQLWVLRRELVKQRPYTPTHLIFSVYLTIISIIRFAFVLIRLTQGQAAVGPDLGFYLALMIDSILLLGYWIAKRQQLPQFQDNKYFNFQEFDHDSSRFMMNRNIEISYLKKISDSFNYIRPTVAIEKNKFMIRLEVFTSKLEEHSLNKSDILRQSDIEPQHKTKATKVLEIISENIYTIGEIKELYKLCGRFDIKQKLNFDEIKMYEMYQNLQSFLEQLFHEKQYYIEETLRFFEIPKQLIENYTTRLRQSFKGSEFDILSKIDKNATLISVRMYKQLWIEDHYIFYMDVLLLEQGVECRPMKRYSDFEALHQTLSTIIRKRYSGQYHLPALPKKHLFHWDEEKVNQRRVQLQHYLRQLTNDQELMIKLHPVKEIVLQFLNVNQLTTIAPILISFDDFFKGIEIFKGSITKALVGNDYVTFYEFKLFKNGLLIRTIKKRFSDFVLLHDALQRWMTNTKITYRMLALPEKHLYKSERNRQQKLTNYLANLITIKDICNVYAINAFFNVGSDDKIEELEFSGIDVPEREIEKQERKRERTMKMGKQDDQFSPKYIPSPEQSSFSSNQRMSELIDQLGR